jgi:GNAT superfamily N-acetyltransferase
LISNDLPVTIEIRRVQNESDFRQLYDLFVAYEADLPATLRHGTVPEIPDLRAAYARRNGAFLAIVGGDAVGCVAIAHLNGETALLLRLFVDPQCRGLGAARTLVTAAIAFAREQGHLRIVLDTNKEQLMPAYALYRSLGFEECEAFATVTYESPTFMQLFL